MRIVRQLMTEALVIALSGGLLGLLICRPAAAALTSIISQGGTPVQLDLRIDVAMLLFILGLSVAAALVCGVAPALRATRGDVAPALQQTARATTGPLLKALARAITSVQFALSLALVATAFLFAFSLYKLTHFDTGLDRRRLAIVDVDAREAGYRGANLARLNRRLLDRLTAVPGVAMASFSENGVYSTRNSNTQIGADGFEAPSGPQRNAFYDQVGPRYFTTIGARLVAGRDFDHRDNAAGAKVTIVNEEFAQHFFPGKNPIGSNIYQIGGKAYQVVGLVRGIRSDVRQAPRRYFYLPELQTEADLYSTRFLVRTGSSPAAVFADVRAAIRGEDPALRITSLDLADHLLDRTLDLDRLIAPLMSGFGVLALTLAAVGVYGRLAYEVTRRTGEIGIGAAGSGPGSLRGDCGWHSGDPVGGQPFGGAGFRG
jgi:predicted permease